VTDINSAIYSVFFFLSFVQSGFLHTTDYNKRILSPSSKARASLRQGSHTGAEVFQRYDMDYFKLKYFALILNSLQKGCDGSHFLKTQQKCGTNQQDFLWGIPYCGFNP
jgi:hypothetical protein